MAVSMDVQPDSPGYIPGNLDRGVGGVTLSGREQARMSEIAQRAVVVIANDIIHRQVNPIAPGGGDGVALAVVHDRPAECERPARGCGRRSQHRADLEVRRLGADGDLGWSRQDVVRVVELE